MKQLLSSTIVLFLFCKNLRADTLVSRKALIHGDLGGSYAVERTAWDEDEQSLLLKALLEYRHRKISAPGVSHDYWLYSQVGYTAMQDSVWVKSSDVLRAQLRWSRGNGRSFRQAWSVFFQTQWLNSYRNYEGKTNWNGGFMNPFRLEGAYGFSKNFFKNSSVQITPASLLIQAVPHPQASAALFDSEPFLRSKHTGFYARYGCSAALMMDEQFYNDLIVLRHQSRFFFNALSSQSMQFDLSNRLCIRFLKYLQVRIETMLLYDPEQSLRLQYRQEILLGVFYEHRK